MGKTDKNNNDVAVLLEDMNGKFDFMVEVLASVKEGTDQIPYINLRLMKIESDIKVIKAAVVKTNQNVADHDEYLKRLKAKFA